MILKVLLLFLITVLTCYHSPAQKKSPPVSIIFDTDIGPDYDDVGAITLLHALADSGECKILATIASNKHKRIAPVLDIFNTYFKRPGVPIGVVRGEAVNLEASQKWDSAITEKYPHAIKTNDEAEDAVDLYRKILASQPDKSVTIVTVGFLTNMANLFQSRADKYSPLTGEALIKKKVKSMVCMAGRFDGEMGKYKEFNVVKDAAASKVVFDKWNTPVVFTGFEIGMKIFTGLPLIQSSVQNSPVKDVYSISIPKSAADKNGRMSWDQTAVLIAVRGYQKYYQGVEGRIIGKEDGSNGWNPNAKGHIYVKEKMPVKQVEANINGLMLHEPLPK